MKKYLNVISRGAILFLITGLVLSFSLASALAADTAASSTATTFYPFKLLAERTLAANEDPMVAADAAAGKIISYISKKGNSYKVVTGGNSNSGGSIGCQVPGSNVRVVEVYSPFDCYLLSTQGAQFHTALPWEYGIYTDVSADGTSKIHVNMLSPRGVFYLEALDPGTLEPIAKIIEDSMTSFAIKGLGAGWIQKNEDQGAQLTQMDIVGAMGMFGISTCAPVKSIPVPAKYNKNPGDFVKKVRDSISSVIDSRRGYPVDNDPNTLAPWQVLRFVDFSSTAMPCSYNIEICSAQYTPLALGMMGAHHAPAIPCEVGVWLDERTVKVSILDPQFIFPLFFKDAFALMTPEQLAMFGQLPPQVMFEIKTMVNQGISTWNVQF